MAHNGDVTQVTELLTSWADFASVWRRHEKAHLIPSVPVDFQWAQMLATRSQNRNSEPVMKPPEFGWYEPWWALPRFQALVPTTYRQLGQAVRSRSSQSPGVFCPRRDRDCELSCCNETYLLSFGLGWRSGFNHLRNLCYKLVDLIWVWVNTYRYIFSGMNIHLPAILGFTRYQGFDPSPFVCSFVLMCWHYPCKDAPRVDSDVLQCPSYQAFGFVVTTLYTSYRFVVLGHGGWSA